MAAQANETFGEGTLPISNIFRIVGGWGGVSGPGVYMLRVVVVGSAAAAVMGMTFAGMGSMLTGVGTLPFVIGACVGFNGSVASHYLSSLKQAYIALDRYPALILLHLRAGYPVFMAREELRNGPFIPISNQPGNNRALIDSPGEKENTDDKAVGNAGELGLTLRQRFERSWRMRSMLIIAWMTAGTAIDEIHGRSEGYLVEKYTEERREIEEARIAQAVAEYGSK